jgi:hypothetical protein
VPFLLHFRDEGLHVDFAVRLFHMLQLKPSEERMHALFREAVTIEKEFICDALPCALIGMNSSEMSTYIEYVADRLLIQMGYSKIWNSDNPFSWMEVSSKHSNKLRALLDSNMCLLTIDVYLPVFMSIREFRSDAPPTFSSTLSMIMVVLVPSHRLQISPLALMPISKRRRPTHEDCHTQTAHIASSNTKQTLQRNNSDNVDSFLYFTQGACFLSEVTRESLFSLICVHCVFSLLCVQNDQDWMYCSYSCER